MQLFLDNGAVRKYPNIRNIRFPLRRARAGYELTVSVLKPERSAQ